MGALDEKVFVIGIGLDKAEEKGKINVSYIFTNPEVGSSLGGGESTNEPPSMTLTIQASDFTSARITANSVIAREVSYDLLRVILVSEELAKEDDFLRFLYTAEKDRGIKRSIHLVVTKEPTQEFFKKNKPKFLSRPHKFYENILARGVETGILPDSRLHHFFRVTEEDANLFLAAYATTELKKKGKDNQVNELNVVAGNMKVEGETNTSQFLGSAIFFEGKMVGEFTGIENRIVMLLHDASSIADVLTVVPDPFNEEYELSIRIMKERKSKVQMNLKAKPPKIHVTLPLSIDVMTDPAMENPIDDKNDLEKLRVHLETYIENRMMKVIKKTQEEYETDPFGWSVYARRHFNTLKEYMDFNWNETYSEMEIDLDVEIRFGTFGRQPKTPGFKGIRD